MVASYNDSKSVRSKVERGIWSGKLDFLMSLSAYTIGLDNIMRFPYLCYRNSGGAFLLAYLTCWLIAAVPIFFMEVLMGQFSRQSGITMWKLCPLFKGVGMASCMIAFLCSIYYCVIISWTLFYIFSSLTYSTLPWLTCNNIWNTAFCSLSDFNASMANRELSNLTHVQTSVVEFWERRVLASTSGIDEFGAMQWELTILLCLVWIITYVAIHEGIIHSRKLIYICAIMPNCLLVVLLIRFLTVDGAYSGLMYLIKLDLYKLLSLEVWKDAATHAVYSAGIGFGTLVALSSYNNYRNNIYRDTIALCIINFLTTLVAACFVFCLFGYAANFTGSSIEQVIKDGMDLVFLLFPYAVSMLTSSQIWSLIFFLMMAMLVLGSMVCMVEGVSLSLCDQFPNFLRKNRKVSAAMMCLTGFALGLPMVSQSGRYWVYLVDSYGGGSLALLFVILLEVCGLSWGFGSSKISDALKDMSGKRIGMFWRFCWKFMAPSFCMVLFAITAMRFEPLMMMQYPWWAVVLGLTMTFMPMLTIPAYAIQRVIQMPGKSIAEKIRRSLQPSTDIQCMNHQLMTLEHESPSSAQCRYGGTRRN